LNGRETEAKFFVRQLSVIEGRLLECGAQLIRSRAHESNLRFDTVDRALSRNGRVLRLRQDVGAHMTYKGPSETRDGVMSREEIEFVVEDSEAARQLLEALGFEVIAFYEKYRTSYRMKSASIMLDELPFGDFVEVEGPDIESIRETSALLGQRWEAAIANSYLALFERIAGARGLDATHLSFEVFRAGKPSAEDLAVQVADD